MTEGILRRLNGLTLVAALVFTPALLADAPSQLESVVEASGPAFAFDAKHRDMFRWIGRKLPLRRVGRDPEQNSTTPPFDAHSSSYSAMHGHQLDYVVSERTMVHAAFGDYTVQDGSHHQVQKFDTVQVSFRVRF